MMLPDIKDILKPRPRKYRNIARHLSPLLLTQEENSSSLSESDIFNDLSSSRGTERFLGLFSKLGIQFALKKFGIFQELKNAGLVNAQIQLDTSDAYKHMLRVVHPQGKLSLISGEIVARRGHFIHPELPDYNLTKTDLDLIIVEWLLLQYPKKSFSRFRPQLPGQEYPGLGIGQLVYETLYWAARRDGADGVLLIPNYLHTGLFYGRQFLFIDPVQEGLLYYIEKELLRKNKLDQLSWACSEGQIIDKTSNQLFQWKPAPMIMPVSLHLKDYFNSPAYSRITQTSRKQYRLKIKKGYRKRYTSNWQAKTNAL